ncbi:MAG: hypothetical protein AAF958_05185 [Planctomycetota bacterium]
MSRWRKRFNPRRHGLTLVELIASLLSASVLMVGLASTMAIATRMMDDSPMDASEESHRAMERRIGLDLVHATAIVPQSGQRYRITVPGAGGTSQDVVYQTSSGSLTRTVDGGVAQVLHESAALTLTSGHRWTASVDNPSQPRTLRSRASSIAQAASSTSLRVDYPEQTQAGEWMILTVASRDTGSMSVANWTNLRDAYATHGRLSVWFKKKGLLDTHADVVLNSGVNQPIAAAIVAFDDGSSFWPVHQSTQSIGLGLAGNAATWPRMIDPADVQSHHFNVQIFAATGDPWSDTRVRLAAANQRVNLRSGGNSGVSLLVMTRHGPTPNVPGFDTLPHDADEDWIQVGIALGDSP